MRTGEAIFVLELSSLFEVICVALGLQQQFRDNLQLDQIEVMMELPRVRVNSMRIDFGRGSPEPKDSEMFMFLTNTLKVKCEDLLCVYRDTNETSMFVKFKNEELLLGTMKTLPPMVSFQYQDGVKRDVLLSSAANDFKYVRLFNLPPEIEDKEIAEVLSKYGKLQRLVREKYSLETGFPIWSGVRGVHMEMTSEVPERIHVRNFPARVYYVGMKQKCFICGSLEHLKADCPRRRRPVQATTGSVGASFKDVLTGTSANASPKGPSEKLDTKPRAEESVTLKKVDEPTEQDSDEQWIDVQHQKKRKHKASVKGADVLGQFTSESGELRVMSQKPHKKQLRLRKSNSLNTVSRKAHPKLTRARAKQTNANINQELLSVETNV